MYYKVTITRTAKTIGSTENYHIFDDEVKTFETKDLALCWIDAEYQGHKKVKMYCDTKEGDTKHAGWIYCFRNADYSHNPIKKWTQQDWVNLSVVTEIKLSF